MLELIAIGFSADQRASIRLEPGHPLRIGRGEQMEMTIPWDPHLSRHHLTLVSQDDDTVRLTAEGSAANPVFAAGQPVTDTSLAAGDFFVIDQHIIGPFQTDGLVAVFRQLLS